MPLNLKTVKLVEDIDPTTRGPRIRLECEELRPRKLLINLKNMTGDQIDFIQQNQGAIMSFPSAREMIMDGRFMVSFAESDDEIYILKSAETVQVSQVVHLEAVDKTSGEIKVSETAVNPVNDEKASTEPKKAFGR